MKVWTIVDAMSGRVLKTRAASNPASAPKLKDGQIAVEGVLLSSKTQWVRFVRGEPIVEDRPPPPIPTKVEGGLGEIVIGALPRGSRIYKDDELIGEATGEEFKYQADVPHRVSFKIAPPFPGQEFEVKIVADPVALEARTAQRAKARRQAVASRLTGLVEQDVSQPSSRDAADGR